MYASHGRPENNGAHGGWRRDQVPKKPGGAPHGAGDTVWRRVAKKRRASPGRGPRPRGGGGPEREVETGGPPPTPVPRPQLQCLLSVMELGARR